MIKLGGWLRSDIEESFEGKFGIVGYCSESLYREKKLLLVWSTWNTGVKTRNTNTKPSCSELLKISLHSIKEMIRKQKVSKKRWE
jgi:hypothetical protein